MNQHLLAQSSEAKEKITSLFKNSPPLLVEVRFPKSGTSPDWYLCEEEEELETIIEAVGPGVELHVSSVWDLQNSKGAISFRK
jgi:hypothetical protein